MTSEGRLVVTENPTRNQIAILLQKTRGKELRALLGLDRIYVWDAWIADHDTVEGLIGASDDFEQLTIYTHNTLNFDLAAVFRYPLGEDVPVEPRIQELVTASVMYTRMTRWEACATRF